VMAGAGAELAHAQKRTARINGQTEMPWPWPIPDGFQHGMSDTGMRNSRELAAISPARSRRKNRVAPPLAQRRLALHGAAQGPCWPAIASCRLCCPHIHRLGSTGPSPVKPICAAWRKAPARPPSAMPAIRAGAPAGVAP